jgi:hypothetical protein
MKDRGRLLLIAQLPGKPLGKPSAMLTSSMLDAWRDIVRAAPPVLRATDHGLMTVAATQLWAHRLGARSFGQLRLMVRLLDDFFIDRCERRRLLTHAKETGMNTQTHAEMPSLCPKCLKVALSRAVGLSHCHVGYACVHRGTFALITVADGAIREWNLRGPNLSPDEILSALDLVQQAARRGQVAINAHKEN